MITISDLIGKPFANKGRGEKGYDCYGLAIEVSKRAGHNLEDVIYDVSKENVFNDNCPAVEASMKDRVRRLTSDEVPMETDLVVFLDAKGRSVHIGVMLDSDKFIHCDRTNTHIARLSSYFRKNRRIYRWL